MENSEIKHFVLVHGACHGAWCWYKVASLLKFSGHKVTVLDLAASGIHPKQVHEVKSFSEYVEPLMEFMASPPLMEERVVLVGHSYGGLCISVAMEKFPERVSVAVYAAAFMPSPDLRESLLQEFNRRLDSYMDTQFTFDQGENNPPTSLLWGRNFMATQFYQLSPPEDLTLAMSLVRPIRLYGDTATLQKEANLSREKYGQVPRVYIICEEDNVMKVDFQRWMIENNPAPEVKVIAGSDHMVMFSQPKELCSCLLEIAEKYP
ncbi:methylesterase 10-like [Juglans regia]|uniref:(S)-hydroxynitrile lyase n=2 Tax=Juglans regia TaxID=51240 RepID=A0A6P9EF36_JUGRE|nr:methylesterase 10-like [Juglans regia]